MYSQRGTALLVTHYVTAGVGFLFVFLRLYVRVFKGRNAGWDDLCIAIAAGLLAFACVVGKKLIDYGIGHHITELTLAQISKAVKWFLIAGIQNWIGLFFVRTSVGFFLLRLLPVTTRRNVLCRWLIVFLMLVNLVFTAAIVGVHSAQCIPLKAVWHFELRAKAKCISSHHLTLLIQSFSALGAVVDFAFALLPLTIIGGLQMNRRVQITLAVCMSLGFLTSACAIVKAAIISDVNIDPTYNLYGQIIAAVIEVNIGIIAASLPGMLQFCLSVAADRHKYTSKASSQQLRKSSGSTGIGAASDRPSDKSDAPPTPQDPLGNSRMEMRKTTDISVQNIVRVPSTSRTNRRDSFEMWAEDVQNGTHHYSAVSNAL